MDVEPNWCYLCDMPTTRFDRLKSFNGAWYHIKCLEQTDWFCGGITRAGTRCLAYPGPSGRCQYHPT